MERKKDFRVTGDKLPSNQGRDVNEGDGVILTLPGFCLGMSRGCWSCVK